MMMMMMMMMIIGVASCEALGHVRPFDLQQFFFSQL